MRRPPLPPHALRRIAPWAVTLAIFAFLFRRYPVGQVVFLPVTHHSLKRMTGAILNSQYWEVI